MGTFEFKIITAYLDHPSDIRFPKPSKYSHAVEKALSQYTAEGWEIYHMSSSGGFMIALGSGGTFASLTVVLRREAKEK